MYGAARAFRFVVIDCAAFFVLTLAAMFVYPGGHSGDPQATGYSFFSNFFSDLGQTQTRAGDANLASLVLFVIALCTVAIGLALFFVMFVRFFEPGSTPQRLSLAAAVCAIGTGISFIGVGCTPWNLVLALHNTFVMWAFRTFLAAVVLDLIAVALVPPLARRFALVFALFAIVLASYVGLLAFGPKLDSVEGALVQSVGQKIIVYASVLTVLVQAASARAFAMRQMAKR